MKLIAENIAVTKVVIIAIVKVEITVFMAARRTGRA